MSVYRPKGKDGKDRSPTYLYDFRVKPKGAKQSERFHGSTSQTSKAAALRVEQRLKELAKIGQLNTSMTVNDACERYWDERMINARSSDDQATNLELIKELLGADTFLVNVSPDLVASAAALRLRTPVRRFNRRTGQPEPTKIMPQPSTVNRQFIEPLRRLLRYAKKVWRLPIDLEQFEWSQLRYGEAEGAIRELRPDEELRYWHCLREDYHPIIEMYLISGRRKGDWCGLLKGKVNLHAGTVTMPSRKKKKPGDIVVTLTERELEIIKEECAKAPESPYVFTYAARQKKSERGQRKPITANGLRRAHENARVAAELPDFRIHDCRHTFATRLLRAKGNLKLVSKALEHADIASTVRYLSVLDDEVVSARSEMKITKTSDVVVPLVVKKTGSG